MSWQVEYKFYTLSSDGHLKEAKLEVPRDEDGNVLSPEKARTYPWVHYHDIFYYSTFLSEEEALACLEEHDEYAWGPYILLKVVE